MNTLLKTSSIMLASASFFALAASANAADVYSDSNPAGYAQTPSKVNWTGVHIGGQVGWGNDNHNMSAEQQTFVADGCSGANALGDGTCAKPEAVSDGDFDEDDFCEKPNGTVYDDDTNDGCEPGDTLRTVGAGETICTGGGSIDPDDPATCVAPTQLVKPETIVSGFIDGLNSSGAFGGGSVGFDVQRGKIVVGAFADYNFGSGSTDVGAEITDIIGINSSVIESGDSWMVGGRLGVLFGSDDRALLYGLGGYGQQDYTYTGFGGSKDVTHSGWILGAGGEYALTHNVFIGLEWQHFFGGEETIATFNDFEGDPSLGDGRVVVRDEVDSDRIMGRLRVKFNSDLFGN